MGRRRPFLAWAAAPLALSGLALYAPPQMDPGATGWWLAAAAVSWFVWFTAFNVPYRSLGPELTPDYDERTRLFAVREGFLVLGSMIGVGGPALAGLALGLPADGTEPARYALFAAIAAGVFALLSAVCVRGVREPAGAAPTTEGVSPAALWRGAREALQNRPFAILLLAYVISAFGSSLPAVLISYFVDYVLLSDKLPMFIGIYFTVGIACLPFWVWLSGRASKRDAWLAALAVNFAFFACIATLGPGQELAYGLLVAGSGLGGVAVLTLPSAMQADVIDHDELTSGQRREGMYTGLWSIAEKAAAALGVGLAMWALDLAGYVANQPQTPQVIAVLKGLYVGVPTVCAALGFLVVLRYPLDRAAHESLRAELAAKRAASEAP